MHDEPRDFVVLDSLCRNQGRTKACEHGRVRGACDRGDRRLLEERRVDDALRPHPPTRGVQRSCVWCCVVCST
jgi:hypothetical protein